MVRRPFSFPVGEAGDAGGSLKFNNPKLLDSLGLESLEESFKDIHEQESAEKERQFLGEDRDHDPFSSLFYNLSLFLPLFLEL